MRQTHFSGAQNLRRVLARLVEVPEHLRLAVELLAGIQQTLVLRVMYLVNLRTPLDLVRPRDQICSINHLQPGSEALKVSMLTDSMVIDPVQYLWI
jgi:hypothetical protein